MTEGADTTGAATDLLTMTRLGELLVADGPHPVCVLDADLRITYLNRRAVEVARRPATELLGRRISELGFAPAQQDLWEAKAAEAFRRREPVVYDYDLDDEKGRRWYENQLLPVLDGGIVTHVVAISHDVTARVAAEEELAGIARTDSLTGLLNRRGVNEAVAVAVLAARAGGAAAVPSALIVDLDDFKLVNDTLGHAVGDRLLAEAAARLRAGCDPGDVVGRLGGDEFVVLVTDRDPGAVDDLADRLVRAFREPLHVDGRPLRTTVSVGVADGRHADGSEADLLGDADVAMYEAKRLGRNRSARFDTAMRRRSRRRLHLEQGLRKAMEEGGLEVHFQPEVQMDSGSVHGVEALVRWRRPDGELLSGGAFLDVAEASGVILDLGEWVFAEAARASVRWATTWPRHPIVTRINLSPLQLADPDFAVRLRRVLDGTGADPARLCLEVTETAVLQRTWLVREHLHLVRDLGIPLALDDFGTGFSSLLVLRDLPIDLLKVDIEFVRALEDDVQTRRLVGGLVDLARWMGCGVTAEGVETEGQRRILMELGCERAQGFLWSTAVPAADIDGILDAGGVVPWASSPGRPMSSRPTVPSAPPLSPARSF